MLVVSKLIPGGRGLAPALVRRAASVSLDWDVRQKSRFDAVDGAGRAFGLFLPRGTVVRGGDVLVAEDGTLIRVEPAPQPVMVVTACASHGAPFDLLRAAYHLGNRHVALELKPDHLKLEPDHVLAEMLRRMHLDVVETEAAFEPESGAYAETASGHGHAHAHGPTPGDAHAHDRPQAHEHEHDHAHAHAHGRDNADGPAPAAAATAVPTPRPLRLHDARPERTAAEPHVHGPGCRHDH